MMIELKLVDDNPFRDFDLDRIVPGRVDALAKNVDDLGFWGGIAVRRINGRYQLAFGHHRLRALIQSGWKEADLNIVDYDDFQMVRAMHKENYLQRKGVSSAVESVAAAIRVLGPVVLSGNIDSVGRILPTGMHQNALNSAVGKLKSGDGLGKDIIQAFLGEDLSEGDIRNAIAWIKGKGKMREYLKVMVDQVDDALQEAARLAAANAPEQLLHKDITLDLFGTNTSIAQAVQKILVSESGQSWIPMEDQYEVVKTIIHGLGGLEDSRCTAKQVKYYLNTYRGNLAALLRKMEGDVTPQERKHLNKIAKNWNKIAGGVGDVSAAALLLTEEVKEGQKLPISKDELHRFMNNDVRNMVKNLESLARSMHIDDLDSLVSIQ